MKKVLKKSFEKYMKETEEGFGEKIVLTGNLYEDLKEYFVCMIGDGMFYMLPKRHAFKVNAVNTNGLNSVEIELLHNHSSIMLCDGIVKVYEDGRVDEYLYHNPDKDIQIHRMQRFILPMRELIKQMKQYYVDHNLVGK